MANEVRAAMLQTRWTGDKESMIQIHEEYLAEAAAAGARVMCFQELFYGPYFCQVQDTVYYDYAEAIPDGPTTRRFPGVGGEARHGPRPADVREGAGGPALQHGGGHRRRRHLPGQVPQDPHPTGQGLLGEVLLPARQPRLPGVRHGGRQGRRLHLLRPALPGGLAGAGPERRPDGVQPISATSRGLSSYLWQLEQPASAVPPTCTSSGPSTGWASRTWATTTSTAPPTSWTRAASSLATSAPTRTELIVRDLDLDLVDEVRNQWAFYRDRRPDMYDPLTRA